MPKLTDAIVKSLSPPAGKKEIKLYDTIVRGFGVRATATGARSFMLNYVVNGRERRITIGGYPAWGVAAARERAAQLRRQVDAGEDPAAERIEARNQKTMKDLWKRYSEEVSALKAASTHRDETSLWNNTILPALGTRRLKSIRVEDIEKLHRDISKTAPVRANRLLSAIRHAFNRAVRWEWMETNPAVGIKKNAEHARDRHLNRDEIQRFVAALREKPDTSSYLALHFILLTGCRKSEALTATWSQFDLDNGIWVKPSAHTKQRRTHRVPLSDGAVNVLRRARSIGQGNVAFPSASGRPLVDIKKAFSSVCQSAGIENFRIHDLRHSFASVLASGGHSLTVIGQMLGHTQAATTLRYSHLYDEVLRDAAKSVDTMANGGD